VVLEKVRGWGEVWNGRRKSEMEITLREYKCGGGGGKKKKISGERGMTD
jgi:hypothetical protein